MPVGSQEKAGECRAQMTAPDPAEGSRISLDDENLRQGLGQLVLALVELLRRLMEKQAIRRMEAGSLSDDEVERLGLTLMRLSEEMERLREYFELEEEDLNLDLGPLGKLL